MARRPPSPQTSIRDFIEWVGLKALLASMAFSPRPVAFALGRFYAGVLDRVVPRLRRTAVGNLEFALPPLSAGERDCLVDEVFTSIARILVSFAKFPSINSHNLDSWIYCEGREYVDEALARGRGVLFATAHLGNWELSALAFAMMARPFSVVTRPLDNAMVDRMVTHYRGLSGNRTITKRDFARGILKALGRNEMVGILADQNDSDGIFIDFFGRAAATSPGLAKLAAKTGAAVVPGFAIWSEKERKYVLRFYEPVAITGDALADTQAIHLRIEEVIREHPGQWLWIHRRWKSRPSGE